MKESFPITTIISYYSNDYRYIEKTIEEAKRFSSSIVVTVCDHYFDGSKENETLLKQTYAAFPEVTFVQYAFLPDRLYGFAEPATINHPYWFDLCNATSRYIGFFFAQNEYLLFLDCDEIIEGDRMVKWLSTKEYQNYDAMRWFQYYYLQKATERFRAWQIGGLFAKKKSINPSLMIQRYDRIGIYEAIEGKKKEDLLSLDQTPMIHHYCWVKPEQERTIKAQNRREYFNRDKKWNSIYQHLLSEIYPDKKENVIEKVPAYFDPLKSQPLSPKTTKEKHIIYVSWKDMLEKELSYFYGL